MITKTNLVYNVNSEYGSYHNISNLIDQVNTDLTKLDSCVGNINQTYKYNLTHNASTYISIGDRRTDLKVITDYTIKRGNTYETGTFNILNNESSSYLIDVSAGATGFSFISKIVDVDFIYDVCIGNSLQKWYRTFYNKGKIYGMPYADSRIIEIDENTYEVKYYGENEINSVVSVKWVDYILLNDKIYGMPYNDHRILMFDTSTKIVSFIGDASNNGTLTNKWVSTIVGKNGKIYSIPNFESRVLEINPIDNSVNYYYIGDTSGGYVTNNNLLCPNGKIYVPPYTKCKKILEIDTNNEYATVRLIGEASIFKNGVNDQLYNDTTMIIDDKLYCLPSAANRILVINSLDASYYFLGDSSIFGNSFAKFFKPPFLINNKIYSLPWAFWKAISIDPIDDSVNFYGDSSMFGSSSSKWTQVQSGSDIFGLPKRDYRIVKFNTLDGSINIIADTSTAITSYSTGERYNDVYFINNKFYCPAYQASKCLEFDPCTLTYNTLGDANEIRNSDASTYAPTSTITDSGKIFSAAFSTNKFLILDTEKREIRLIAKDTSTNINDASINFITKIIKK